MQAKETGLRRPRLFGSVFTFGERKDRSENVKTDCCTTSLFCRTETCKRDRFPVFTFGERSFCLQVSVRQKRQTDPKRPVPVAITPSALLSFVFPSHRIRFSCTMGSFPSSQSFRGEMRMVKKNRKMASFCKQKRPVPVGPSLNFRSPSAPCSFCRKETSLRLAP